jgi:hypothetical protein
MHRVEQIIISHSPDSRTTSSGKQETSVSYLD